MRETLVCIFSEYRFERKIRPCTIASNGRTSIMMASLTTTKTAYTSTAILRLLIISLRRKSSRGFLFSRSKVSTSIAMDLDHHHRIWPWERVDHLSQCSIDLCRPGSLLIGPWETTREDETPQQPETTRAKKWNVRSRNAKPNETSEVETSKEEVSAWWFSMSNNNRITMGSCCGWWWTDIRTSCYREAH